MSRIEIFAGHGREYLWTRQIAIHLLDRETREYAKEITWEKHEEGAWVPPIVNLPQEQAQALMDQLWNCGLRPTEGSGSAGSLAATERHLEDMRSLVFKTPPKDRR